MPNVISETRVVRELLNTYLAIRVGEAKYGWENLDLGNPPATGIQHDKLEIIANLIKAMPTRDVIDNIHPWTKFVYALAKFEDEERAAKEMRGASPLGLRVTSWFIKSDSLLERTLHAIRAFVVQRIKEGVVSKETLTLHKHNLHTKIDELQRELAIAEGTRNAEQDHIKELKKEITECERKLKALVGAETDVYHNQFFKEVILTRDQHKDKNGVPQLDEKTFQDYCANIINSKRSSPVHLNKLINAMTAPKCASPLQNHSTFTANVAVPDKSCELLSALKK